MSMGRFNEFTGWTDMGNPTHTISSKLTTYSGTRYKWDSYGESSRGWAWSGAGNFLVRNPNDLDEDGVINSEDECPDTETGS